jgi:hypothetical protein
MSFAGYARLLQKHELSVPALLHSSVVADLSLRKSVSIGTAVEE